MIRLMLLLLILAAVFTACRPDQPLVENEQTAADQLDSLPTADRLIGQAIETHFGDGWDEAAVTFNFRNRTYGIYRMPDGRYSYTRSYQDTTAEGVRDIEDHLNNQGFGREINGFPVTLDSAEARSLENSLNSVRYFFMLPYGLQDPAVNSAVVGEVEIDGQSYDKVRVTFDEAGGGVDHEDVYFYYFNRESRELDFLAYRFHVEEGGIRFRKAVNKRRVNGMLFQDYINYKAPLSEPFDRIEELYKAGQLEELSRIENTGIEVQ